ncbi:MAG: hypothetical protein KUG69_14705 [Marinosulfonomonas sp.]|nr:hypothetical protein [Marinosulfonomonas sp.]
MLLAQALPPVAAPGLPPFSFQHKEKRATKHAVQPEPNFTVTYCAVEMDGSSLALETSERAVAQLVEAVRLAELRGKNELLIINIAPWLQAGANEATEVALQQENFEEAMEKVCLRLKRGMPEIRLSRRAGEFDLRCYLGVEKPTDHIYEDDWISDSR